ncbi:MAG: hypothetical protein ACI8TP_002909 [Acidimicrobiales bacterium]|jgi:hypothetical protein
MTIQGFKTLIENSTTPEPPALGLDEAEAEALASLLLDSDVAVASSLADEPSLSGPEAQPSSSEPANGASPLFGNDTTLFGNVIDIRDRAERKVQLISPFESSKRPPKADLPKAGSLFSSLAGAEVDVVAKSTDDLVSLFGRPQPSAHAEPTGELTQPGASVDFVPFEEEDGPKRRFLLFGALVVLLGLVGLGVALRSGSTSADLETVTSALAPTTVTTAAPTTAAPTTVSTVPPTTAAPTTTVAPSSTVAPATAAPIAPAAPRRTTTTPRRPATTAKPATTEVPTTVAAEPVVTFSPPTWTATSVAPVTPAPTTPAPTTAPASSAPPSSVAAE